MFEIIADPEEYQIDHLINGTGNANIELSEDEREKWSDEILGFSNKVSEFAKKSKELAILFSGREKISAA